jgi:hypothetical protein
MLLLRPHQVCGGRPTARKAIHPTSVELAMLTLKYHSSLTHYMACAGTYPQECL